MSSKLIPNVFSRRTALLGAAGLLAGCEEVEKTVPLVALLPITGLKLNTGFAVGGVDTNSFSQSPTLLNIWASWCPICRDEHEMLKTLSADRRYRLVGLVHKDSAENARAFLLREGNPFAALSVDTQGVITRALGVRGVPYTFVVDRNRKTLARVIGGLFEEKVEKVIRPAVLRALAPPTA